MIRIFGGVAAVILALWFAVAQPVWFCNRRSAVSVDPSKLKRHVEMISLRLSPRDYLHTYRRMAEVAVAVFETIKL